MIARHTVCFWIPGTPHGKGRHRARLSKRFRTSKAGTLRQGIDTYTPAKTKAYEQSVAWIVAAMLPATWPKGAPMALEIFAGFRCPRSWSNARKSRARLGEEIPGEFDADNISKAICDGANRILFDDDRQVVSLIVLKAYVADECEGVTVRASALARGVTLPPPGVSLQRAIDTTRARLVRSDFGAPPGEQLAEPVAGEAQTAARRRPPHPTRSNQAGEP